MRIAQIGEAGINLIKYFEQFRAKPYLDTGGIPTIGYGTTYYPNGKRVKIDDSPITEQEALVMMLENLNHYEKAVDSFTRDDLTQNQFDALVSFCYNIGVEMFRRSTLLKLVNQNPLDPNISHQFKRWIYDDGKIYKGLIKRRAAESQLYFT